VHQLFELFLSFLPLLATTAGVVFFLFLAYWALLGRHPELVNERRLSRQLVMFGLTAAGAIAIALALPVSDSTRNQVIALIGVLLSGVVAFSSTTIVSNLMAGLMLHMTRPFRTGDFIRVGDFFGRVVGRGLFNTEIQTEHRELVYLSNTHLITNPVTVVRSSGTIVTATLSLGYDVHHTRVKSLLLDAAREIGLEDPFVKIVELGNYAITYRISGLLTEIKGMLTTRSNFFETILDTLHGAGVEIVSPSFMNQRRLDNEVKVLPVLHHQAPSPDAPSSEEIVFDKAEQAEQQEKAEIDLHERIRTLEGQARESEGEEKEQIEDLIVRARNQLAEVESHRQDVAGAKPAEQVDPASANKPPV